MRVINNDLPEFWGDLTHEKIKDTKLSPEKI
jgi:hypothetical protein